MKSKDGSAYKKVLEKAYHTMLMERALNIKLETRKIDLISKQGALESKRKEGTVICHQSLCCMDPTIRVSREPVPRQKCELRSTQARTIATSTSELAKNLRDSRKARIIGTPWNYVCTKMECSFSEYDDR